MSNPALVHEALSTTYYKPRATNFLWCGRLDELAIRQIQQQIWLKKLRKIEFNVRSPTSSTVSRVRDSFLLSSESKFCQRNASCLGVSAHLVWNLLIMFCFWPTRHRTKTIIERIRRMWHAHCGVSQSSVQSSVSVSDKLETTGDRHPNSNESVEGSTFARKDCACRLLLRTTL